MSEQGLTVTLLPKGWQGTIAAASPTSPSKVEQGGNSAAAAGLALLPEVEQGRVGTMASADGGNYSFSVWFFKYVGFLPLIFTVQMCFFASRAIDGMVSGLITSHGGLAILLACVLWTAWYLVVRALAKRDLIEKYVKLRYLPMFWPPVPWVIVAGLAALAPDFLPSLIAAVGTPRLGIICMQCIRILAVMSIIKARQGLFPPLLARLLAWPDLIFGISAWLVLGLHLGGLELSHTAFAAWNLCGILAIIPVGTFSFSMPALGFAEPQSPPVEVMTRLPLVWGPSTVVPLFLVISAIAAVPLVQ
mmetsp:Transcript_3345/g.8030  ORF Transcript_3345/g.8030 Transcript_3345/m.8030 type:complete len:304 (+) Transcript_3345:60-971(+)